jgi:hypothetical protein
VSEREIIYLDVVRRYTAATVLKLYQAHLLRYEMCLKCVSFQCVRIFGRILRLRQNSDGDGEVTECSQVVFKLKFGMEKVQKGLKVKIGFIISMSNYRMSRVG